jgi:hypothetical protein
MSDAAIAENGANVTSASAKVRLNTSIASFSVSLQRDRLRDFPFNECVGVLPQEPPTSNLPSPQKSIPATGDQNASIRAESDCLDDVVCSQGSNQTTSGEFPNVHSVSKSAGSNIPVVWADSASVVNSGGNSTCGRFGRFKFSDLPECGHVPNSDRSIPTCRSEIATVAGDGKVVDPRHRWLKLRSNPYLPSHILCVPLQNSDWLGVFLWRERKHDDAFLSTDDFTCPSDGEPATFGVKSDLL